MLWTKASLQSNKELRCLLGKSGVDGANKLLQRTLESRNLLKRLVEESLRSFRVRVPQVVDGDNQSISLLFNHIPRQLVVGAIPEQESRAADKWLKVIDWFRKTLSTQPIQDYQWPVWVIQEVDIGPLQLAHLLFMLFIGSHFFCPASLQIV